MPDYRGARGSNAGDDFHELWTLRQALKLLDQDANLTAITVEGLRTEDESGVPQDTWDGVDCAFYYGGDHADSAERIVIDQLKYSAADPDQTWSIARLTHSTNRRQDNCVFGKLAKAYSRLARVRPDLAASGNLVVRLVSNQQIEPSVLSALSVKDGPNPSDRSRLQAVSGLDDDSFQLFAAGFDLTECGSSSRFEIEKRVITTISDWTEDDARTEVNNLMRFVRRAMMPEAKREFITHQSILAQLGFSDPSALFPCPTAIKRIEKLVPREVSQTVADRMLRGDQRICLHGNAGCGKTTVLQDIEALLPRGSVVVVFDCYGGGRYLDSDAYRHRPQDAFLHLSNDLARRLRIPLLMSRSTNIDYPRAFKRRLDRAAEVVASQNREALLVIAVDAADNSITAANTRSPAERSFVHDFVRLGELPSNVRLIVTSRTGQLPNLNLPRDFASLEVAGFSRHETTIHVQSRWSDAPADWLEDFDYLTQGNPRVQQYALDYAGPEPTKALDYLRPDGKRLTQIFQEHFEHARRKVGQDQDIKAFCSGLIALPRPVPAADLSAVTGLSEAHVCDLCADLAPGIRLSNGLISFADEDFEDFVRAEADEQLDPIQTLVASHFLCRHQTDPYAATYVAAALFAAGRRQEILALLNPENEPKAIGDPVLRRETQLGRLRTAMRVCREAGNSVDAILILLTGAEALKTDVIIRETLIQNPDLTASFVHDASSKMLLRDPDEFEHHGPLLCHMMAADARENNSILVREGQRQFQAWMQRRKEQAKEQQEQYPNSPLQYWSLSDADIAAETEAMLRMTSPRDAMSYIRKWRPKSVAIRVASALSAKLIMSGEGDLVEHCIAEGEVPTPWDLFLLTPLALAGRRVDLSRLEASLASLSRRNLVRLDMLRDIREDDDWSAEYLDTILSACELLIARGGNRACVIPVLERISDKEMRQRDRLFTFQVTKLDLSLRALALLERLAGHRMTLETYWVDPPSPPGDLASKEIEHLKRRDSEKREELRDFVGPLIDLYDIRAQALLRLIAPDRIKEHFQPAIVHYHGNDYRVSRQPYASAMRTRVALAITRLMAVPDLDHTDLLDCAKAILGSHADPFGADEAEIFTALALNKDLHPPILSGATARARVIRDTKASADDKITALVRTARLLLPISPADAKNVFNQAIEVAGEVNIEAMHEISLFAPLAGRAVDCMSFDERRAVACKLDVVISDASVRLSGYDHFPWEKGAQALTTFDPCLALAATARWADAGIIGQTRLLPTVLDTALACHAMTPAQVSALSSFLDHFDENLLIRVVDEAIGRTESHDHTALAEHLAREELLRFGKGTRPIVCEKLSSLRLTGGPSFWMNQLARTTAFQQAAESSRTAAGNAQADLLHQDSKNASQPDPLADIDWTAHRFVTPEEICGVSDLALATAKASGTFIPVAAIVDRIGSAVALRDRAAHLEALSLCECDQIPDYELVQAISRRIDDWRATPSVTDWVRARVMQVVADRLPDCTRWLDIGQSPLPTLLAKLGLPDDEICATMLEAMERHIDALGTASIYGLVGLVGRYCQPEDAARVAVRFTERLVQRIPTPDRDDWTTGDLPNEVTGGIARFLYALMGDVDLRTRWRAAHALRSIARLGDADSLAEIIALYDRTAEPVFRAPDTPFYWLAARLWLVIALDRIAVETPSILRPHGNQLFDIATDDSFPHVLLRSFAKSAVRKLVANDNLTLNSTQHDMLDRANTSPLRRRTAQKSQGTDFNKYTYQEQQNRRFHFDIMDTLPYWYTTALRTFADVKKEDFLDTAERWIVDHWGVTSNPWRWDDEPRKDRLSDRSYSGLDHGHGSLPTLERFHTHLEWHAMWCAAGELIKDHPLAEVEDPDDSFEAWLSRNGLTAPPEWLADLRSPKPLENQLWFVPQADIDEWLDSVGGDEFLAEMGLLHEDGPIVVGSYHNTRSRAFATTVRIHTALVSPETAAALVRALQSVSDSWSYRIPAAGDELEITNPPYKLVGWLNGNDHDQGIDEGDPLRYEVGAIGCRPSDTTSQVLNLTSVTDDPARWIDAAHGFTVFVYEAWGDDRGDEAEERRRYNESVRSNGWRLRIDRKALEHLGGRTGFDLIAEIEITRRNRGYDDYSRYGEETTKESRYDRIILLRRDGTIEAAEGRLGTWTISCS